MLEAGAPSLHLRAVVLASRSDRAAVNQHLVRQLLLRLHLCEIHGLPLARAHGLHS